MAHYNKGANAERELIRLLFERGFSVVRAAGSGVNILPAPDLVAVQNRRILAIEVKAWKNTHLSLPHAQLDDLIQWAERAGGDAFVAWKFPRRDWLFIRPGDFNKTGKNYTVSLKQALRVALNLEVVSGRMKPLTGENPA